MTIGCQIKVCYAKTGRIKDCAISRRDMEFPVKYLGQIRHENDGWGLTHQNFLPWKLNQWIIEYYQFTWV